MKNNKLYKKRINMMNTEILEQMKLWVITHLDG